MDPDQRYAERIKWETFARVLALSGLLVFGVAMDLGLGPQPITQLPEVVLYKLITAFYVASFIALLATYLMPPTRHRALAWASLTIDVAFATSLVVITHGTDSVFLFGLPLAVLAGAALLERPGAFVSASAAAVVVTFLMLVDAKVLALDLEPWTVAWLRALGPRDVGAPFEVAFQGLVQVAALYGTAVLSSQLVVELNRARAASVAERRELAALRVRYEDVWSSLPDGLATVSREGNVRTANPSFLRILGVDLADVIDRSLGELLPQLSLTPGVSSATIEIPRSAPASEIWRARTDGERQILAVRVELLRDADGRATGETLLLVRDVTDIRAREEVHRNRERLATVGAMAMAIAHEIRNPLASISGAVQMLDATLEVAEDERHLMAIAVRETRQLSDWIGEFLDYAKPGSTEFELLDLVAVVREKVEALRQDPRLADGGITLSFDPTEERTTLLADRRSVASLAWNLLRNAVDAVMERDERHIAVAITATPEALTQRVDDSGPGVPESERARLFEPFFSRREGGTGLGLATVHRAVENHGGQISVTDGPLGGARFEVILPRDLRRAREPLSNSRSEIPAVAVRTADLKRPRL